jgi:hypothetical protein
MFKKGQEKLSKELDILNILQNFMYFDTALFVLMSKK